RNGIELQKKLENCYALSQCQNFQGRIMTAKALPISPRAQKWRGIDDAYHKLLYWYYDRQNLAKTRPLARRLERLLSEVSSDQQTILGEGAWSLVLECKGDLLGAIQRRENEIQLIKRLLQISSKAP